jgi:hypothetical protein
MQRTLRLVLLGGLVSSFGVAQEVNVPLQNWTVPPYTTASTGGIRTMTDVSGPRPFVPIVPCRVVDTRGNGAPITGGIFTNSEARDWLISGKCGIPSGADAVSVNFTVVSAPATPQGAFLLAWPTGSPPPPGSITAIITYGPGVTVISNAAIVPLGQSAGQMTVNVSHSTHIIMDVNGYFSDTLQMTLNGFAVRNESNPIPTIDVRNDASNCTLPDGCAIRASSFTGNAVSGYAQQPGTATTYGVRGNVSSQGTLAAGVKGEGRYKGVHGAGQNFGDAAGVFGNFGVTLSVSGAYGPYNPHGVRGEGALGGVLGISPFEGVAGSLINSSGSEIAYGVLGLAADVATDPGCPSSPCSGPWGVFAHANIGATGAKYFLDPDPKDPSRAIGYISLEGPEAGTYFRGRARFQNGTARIPVPEHFRLVTAPDGLTVQITPIGEMATVAVVRMDLQEIVVKASRNVEFSYLVQGVRETHKEISPFRGSGEFAPRFADSKIPDWLSPAQKRRLIENGTYREDGTVNMETARRLGWDRIWEQRERPTPQPTEP